MRSVGTRKLSYRKDDRVMRPMYGCPGNFRESLTTPMAPFPKIFNRLVPIEPINVHAKSEVRTFTRSWERVKLRGTLKKLGSPWIRPRSLFSKTFNGLLLGWTL